MLFICCLTYISGSQHNAFDQSCFVLILFDFHILSKTSSRVNFTAISSTIYLYWNIHSFIDQSQTMNQHIFYGKAWGLNIVWGFTADKKSYLCSCSPLKTGSLRENINLYSSCKRNILRILRSYSSMS